MELLLYNNLLPSLLQHKFHKHPYSNHTILMKENNNFEVRSFTRVVTNEEHIGNTIP